MSSRNPFKGEVVEGGLQGIEALKGGFVKNNRPKGRFDDESKGGDRPKTGGPPKYRKPEALPPAEKNNEEKEMTGKPVNTTLTAPRPQPQVSDNEPCPLCGYSKPKEVRFTGRDGKEVVNRPIVCKACNDKYRAYEERVRKDNISLLVANPTAPEPAEPKSKFDWVLSQIDLEKFAAESQAAEATYRAKYDETIVTVLVGRGYLVGTPEWKGITTSRPANLQFTKTAWGDGKGNGPLLQLALEKGISNLRWEMKKSANHLEAATRVKAELEAELAKNASVLTVLTPDVRTLPEAAVLTPDVRTLPPADASTPQVGVEPPAKKSRKSK